VRAGCASGIAHKPKACPVSGCGHSSLSIETTAVALQVFLADFVASSLLFYASNRNHVRSRHVVKLSKNVFNVLKPFLARNEANPVKPHAVHKPEL